VTPPVRERAPGDLLARSAPGRAPASYRQALALARQVRSPLDEARALEGIARCAARAGDHAVARDGLRAAIAIYQRIGVPEAGPAAGYLADLEAEALNWLRDRPADAPDQ
jgi:hypothetical protein